MFLFIIETSRLGFIPMTMKSLEAAVKGEKELQFLLGLRVVEGLIEPIHKERVFPIRLEKLRKNPEISKWYGFVVEKEYKNVIGMMGYKSPPDKNGLIESDTEFTINFKERVMQVKWLKG